MDKGDRNRIRTLLEDDSQRSTNLLSAARFDIECELSDLQEESGNLELLLEEVNEELAARERSDKEGKK